jgi:hypothetical protein
MLAMNATMSCILCASATLWALSASLSACKASNSCQCASYWAACWASNLSTVACNIQPATFKQCKGKVHVLKQ